MKRTTLKLPCIATPNKWLGSEDKGYWEYGNYRCCYLTMLKLKNGKYRPNVGGEAKISLPGELVPVEGYFQFDTFEEAANKAFKYVDWLRDVRDIEEKHSLQKKLHKLYPHIHPA